MKISGNHITLIAVIFMLFVSFTLTQQITYRKRSVEYRLAEQLVNDSKFIAMYSMKEIPVNISRVSLLKYFKTNVGIFGEKILITYDRPVKIVDIEERDVQYKVKAIVILVKYSEGGVTNIIIGPFVKKDIDIYIITTVILNKDALHMKVLGVVVNSSEVVEVKGCVEDETKRVPNAKLDIFMYKVEEGMNITQISIEDILTKGVLLYKSTTDYLGKFRIRILSSIVPKDHVIIIVASKSEGGYIVLENKPGTLTNVTLRGGKHE